MTPHCKASPDGEHWVSVRVLSEGEEPKCEECGEVVSMSTEVRPSNQRSNDPRDWCEVCLGSGLPQSGIPCICGGAGTSGEEKVGLRKEVIRCRDEIERLRAALEDVASNPENRKRYYEFRQYMSHINGCKGGGDQACACGKASIAWNLDELVDGAERAFSVLEAARPDETKGSP